MITKVYVTGVKIMPKLSKKERKNILKAMGLMSQIGLTVVACVVLGIFLGRFLDDRLGTTPWLLIVFALLGVVSAFKAMVDLSKKF